MSGLCLSSRELGSRETHYPRTHLADNKELFSPHDALLKFLSQRIPDLALVLVHVGTVKVAVPNIDGKLHCASCCSLERLEPEEKPVIC